MKLASELHKVLAALERNYLNALLLTNIISLYLYLFWDSMAGGMPALSGGPADPLFLKLDRFMDWINTLHSAGMTRPYGLENQVAMPVYGPFTYAALKPLALLLNVIPSSIELSRILWLGITGIVLVSLLRNVQSIRAALHPVGQRISPLLLASTLLLSYPFLFAFDRGNFELITLGLVGWYLALICREREESAPETQRFQSISGSDLVLALAVCIKPYTLLFAICSSRQGPSDMQTQLRQAAGALTRILGLAIVISILSMVVLYKGDISLGYRQLSHWQQEFRDAYVIGTAGDNFFCSPFIAIKTILLQLSTPGWLMNLFFKLYPVVALAYCAITFIAIFLSPYRQTWTKDGLTIMLTTIAVTLLIFPFNANEYKAIYVLLPFVLAYTGSRNSAEVATCCSGPRSEYLIKPKTLCIALCFTLAANRYGVTGIGALASLVATMAVASFPILLLRSINGESRINIFRSHS